MKPILDQSMAKSKRRKRNNTLLLFGVLLLIFAIVLAITSLLKGKETTTGAFPSPVKNEALTCNKSNIAYSKISALGSSSQDISVTMIFNETDSLNTISLDYTLKFESSEAAEKALASAQAKFTEFLSADKFSFSEFNNKFTHYKDKLIASIYGGHEDIASNTRASYFMLDAKNNTPKTLEDFRKAYEKQNFKCTSTTDK